ncbi:type II toxin-antitoxin system VapC family toxin [Nostoc sp. 'Lobaria pulmonaria (5183) cyanobiont']|uniref:type II toxin-antitoxin system VapC family toxin n=1 Tax=Nostoc sp. 'Lobaria pulmonaria (5183) cyanobiont' TaxID=1618022 RepID=UPI000CF358D9|nr:type II toxin-antitoxin system VapC family toxin [Nostoc sp. 'Lobaria pulmonaria (5183) cyanobiont']AVH70298.1 PIN domain protein [Nostoc sp. 'Lobaria pulmonaria (5183) cyanobiont']
MLTQPSIFLDTNIVLYFLGGRLINPLPSGEYFISVITEIELLSYPSLSLEEETQIIDFLNKITIIGIDSNIKNLTIAFRKQYKLRLPDAIIAATAKSLNATLFTNDVRLVNLTEVNTQSVQIV